MVRSSTANIKQWPFLTGQTVQPQFMIILAEENILDNGEIQMVQSERQRSHALILVTQ